MGSCCALGTILNFWVQKDKTQPQLQRISQCGGRTEERKDHLHTTVLVSEISKRCDWGREEEEVSQPNGGGGGAKGKLSGEGDN